MTHSDPPSALREITDLLRALESPWAMAGGWALDLALNCITRPHADVDIAVFRSDQSALRAALPGWRFEIAVDRTLEPWAPGVWLQPPVHEVHARPSEGIPGRALEFLLNEQADADWVYRRDPAIRLPLARAIRATRSGIRALAPEVVLLYKSKAPRAVDEQDFCAARPLLDTQARAWLRAALLRV